MISLLAADGLARSCRRAERGDGLRRFNGFVMFVVSRRARGALERTEHGEIWSG